MRFQRTDRQHARKRWRPSAIYFSGTAGAVRLNVAPLFFDSPDGLRRSVNSHSIAAKVDGIERWSRPLACLLMIWIVLLVGCNTSSEINTKYGRRRGARASKSVNGTAVLGYMFEQAGYDVSSWRRLSPKLEKEQVIVWAPDEFNAPETEAVNYLENWLSAEPRRTLIYVGRDYDASIEYWQSMLAGASARERIELRRRLSRAQSEHHAARSRAGERSCKWFTITVNPTPRRIEQLEGVLSRGINATEAELRVSSHLVLPIASDDKETQDWEYVPRSEPMLQSNEETLVARIWREHWTDSQVIVVADGSWLLNLPLVNNEHRKLAGKLIESCGVADRVCFLESGPGSPRVTDSDTTLPIMLRAFSVWPINAILLHLTVLGILFCFSILPIFGRARTLEPDAVSDFGKHVAALGELLERADGEDFARRKLRQYHDLLHGKGKET